MIRIGRVSSFNTDFSGWGVSLTYWPGRIVALRVMRSAMDRELGGFSYNRGRLAVRFVRVFDFLHCVDSSK